jgi:hypothetical protein
VTSAAYPRGPRPQTSRRFCNTHEYPKATSARRESPNSRDAGSRACATDSSILVALCKTLGLDQVLFAWFAQPPSCEADFAATKNRTLSVQDLGQLATHRGVAGLRI